MSSFACGLEQPVWGLVQREDLSQVGSPPRWPLLECSLQVLIYPREHQPWSLQAKCRAAGKARERMRNLRWHSTGGDNRMSQQWAQHRHSKEKNKCTSHSGSPDQSYASTQECAASLAIRVPHQEGGGEAVLWRVGHPRAPGASLLTWQDTLKKNT